MDTQVSVAAQAYREPPAMTALEVAEALQVSLSTFYNRRESMKAGGFPQKLPGVARWPRRAVMDWIDRGGAL